MKNYRMYCIFTFLWRGILFARTIFRISVFSKKIPKNPFCATFSYKKQFLSVKNRISHFLNHPFFALPIDISVKKYYNISV